MNYTTKSGTNQFHGRATYYWNGRAFNANTFFNNAYGAPKSFANANQYGGDAGGPILKNKVFWYFDTEGIRLMTPSSAPTVLIPDPAFETATIDNLMANHPASVPSIKISSSFTTRRRARTAPFRGAASPPPPPIRTPLPDAEWLRR